MSGEVEARKGSIDLASAIPSLSEGVFLVSAKNAFVPVKRDNSVNTRVVGKWVKFHILIYLGPLHKYPIKEGFLTSWGV